MELISTLALTLRVFAGAWVIIFAVAGVVWLVLTIADLARRWPRGIYFRVRP